MNTFKWTLIVVYSIVFLSKSDAQINNFSDVRQSFSISLGLEQAYFKDLNFSPLNYTGFGGSLNLDYTKKRPSDDLFFTKLQLAATQLSAIPENTNSSNTAINLSLGYLKKIGKNESPSPFI